MMSIFSPRSSETTIRTREPRGPTQAPTGSTPSACATTAILERYPGSRAAGGGRDLLDHGLDALRVVVALAVDLLGLGQQRLDALAQLHERVAGVRLLDDAGDQLAHAVAVLLEHHVALGLADPLQDHLLGRLRGDPAEVVRRDVADLDLVLEVAQTARIDVRRLRDDDLAGLRIHPALERARGLLLGLVEQLV